MGAKKVKISSVKRATHLRHKKAPLSKQQLQRLAQQKAKLETANHLFNVQRQKQNLTSAAGQRKRSKHEKRLAQKAKSTDEDNEEEGNGNPSEDGGEELLNNISDMLDQEDLELLMKKGDNSSLDDGRSSSCRKLKKRKYVGEGEDNEDIKCALALERQYTQATVQELQDKKFKVDLLPIKSRSGDLIMRSKEVDYVPANQRKEKVSSEEQVEEESSEEDNYLDSDVDVLEDKETTSTIRGNLISNADLLIARQQEIEKQKYRIGIICSGILEKPEDKIHNFNVLFDLMDEFSAKTGQRNLLTVRKLAMVSMTEVFKDILPEYRVGQIDTQSQKVRKSTLERATYENALLQKFKRFLQRMEQITAIVTTRRYQGLTGGGQRRTPEAIKITEIAVQCLCELLNSHPYFNYVKNVAQLLVYMLNCNYVRIRATVHKTFRTLFATDKKLEMTLFVIRRINHLIKSKHNIVHVECVTCLMGLKVKQVNLDAEKELEMKQKQLQNHRQRLYNLSKKERKRHKKLMILNKELEETRAEENKQSKHLKLTEIVKMMFTIYFRILKNEPNSAMLSSVLEGLAEFAHVINIDFFVDLIEVLNNILETKEDLGYREQLHCIQTIFVILSGQGEVLNIDPMRFYQHLYRNMLAVNAATNHQDFLIILKTLNEVLVKRKRCISQQRLMAFIKRLLTVSLQLLHHGTLACLGSVKTTFQLSSVLDILLDTDCSLGYGRYDPELDDPEYCNAASTALYELTLLNRHYHPTVRKYNAHIANGVPAMGDHALSPEIGKLTAIELFEQFDSTEMVFNPAIAIPQKSKPKINKKPITNGGEYISDYLRRCHYHVRLTSNKKFTENTREYDIHLNFYQQLQQHIANKRDLH